MRLLAPLSPGSIPKYQELCRGTNARGCEGSGLGLAPVRRVVDRHEGTVTVRSRRDGGRGTVFAVTLPVTIRIPQNPKSIPSSLPHSNQSS